MTTTIKSTLILPATLALGLFGFGGTAKADVWEHIDQLALQLQHQAEELHDEAHAHFEQTPLYRALDENIDQMEQLAVHIHNLAHGSHCVRTLSNDVRSLQVLQHRTEDLLGHLGRWGQINPVAYQHLAEGIRDVGVTAQHLRRDLRELEHAQFHGGGGVPYQAGYQPVGQPVVFPQVQPAIGCPREGRTIQFRIGFQR